MQNLPRLPNTAGRKTGSFSLFFRFALLASPTLRFGIDHRQRHRLLAFGEIAPCQVGGDNECRRIVPVQEDIRRIDFREFTRGQGIAVVDQPAFSIDHKEPATVELLSF